MFIYGGKTGHNYILINMLSNDKINYDEPVDLVGISSRITSEKTAYKIADEFRKRKVKVVLGGPQVSVVPFNAKKHADSVVIGEGDIFTNIIPFSVVFV